ncbi:TRAP transporter 4TM/12TM fusion protein OS=Ureibacillus acetophenoni OX=614649 GN=SAMN05877842_10363 PE=4 SV=1 [Ureibacillus acetophenoni]
MNAVDFPMASFMDIAIVAVTSIVGVIGLGAAIEGYFATHMNIIYRIILGVGALLMLIPEPFTDIIGTVIVLVIFALNYMENKKLKNKLAI